jgi:hypothetical protein
LLPSLCPQYSFPYPGFKGAGGGVTHVDGEPKTDAASGGSAQNVKPDGSVQKVNPDGTVNTGGNNELGGPSSDVVLGAFQGAPTKPDAPPPTPAPYAATLVFDTSADNGAAGTGEAIKVDSSVDASFVGGAPVVPAAAKMGSRPIELALVRVGDGIVQGASKLRNLAQMKTRPFAATKMPFVLPGGHHRRFWQTKLSQEEDTGDHSNDDNLQDIDDQLGRLSSMYDKKVGTINFGSRGMTDTRNDFLEGSSGSIFNTMQTSAPGSKKSHVSKLLALVPTGLRIIPDAKVAALEDIGAKNNKKSYDTELVALLPTSTRIMPDPQLAKDKTDTGGDHSNDDNFQEIDDQLGRLSSIYDKKVGTINFGSRGMTDTRNDFLEGSSGSIFSMQTSAPGTK